MTAPAPGGRREGAAGVLTGGTLMAFMAETSDSGFRAGVREVSTAILPDDGVTIGVEWSSVNYKDALAASRDGKVARRSPLIVGIDLAGLVLDSRDPAFRPGTQVLAHGYGLGVTRHGGLAQAARVPAEWLVPLPDGLKLREAMVLGTAGYTAALSILALLDRGLEVESGPVLVTGASGGVGSVAVAMLAHLGFEVVASSGTRAADDRLRQLGASDVIGRLPDGAETPLRRERWAGAVDCVGGPTLAHLVSELRYGASVAASGNTGGAALPATVLPFILRGVSLLGIDSVANAIDHRRGVWRRIATDLIPADLSAIAVEVGLSQVSSVIDALLRGEQQGRAVVDVNA